MERLSGSSGAAGIAVGSALVVRHNARDVRFLLQPGAVARELARLEQAAACTRSQLEAIKARLADTVGPEHAYLFDVQLLMLDDPLFVPRAAALVRTERLNAEWALQRAFEEIAVLVGRADDPVLSDRHGDLADLAARLAANLRGDGPLPPLARSGQPIVLVADTLAPSVVATLDRDHVAGFVTERGTRTSHTAILARSLGIPAVVGVVHACRLIRPGATVVLDGTRGEVLVDPPERLVEDACARRAALIAAEAGLADGERGPVVTKDGVPVQLEANIDRPEDVAKARRYGAEGIGLIRSEFLLVRETAASLTEAAQYATYRRLLEAMAPGAVTVRTFDLHGGRRGGNPATPESAKTLLRTQLHALCRAARHGPLRIMFPLISGVEELDDYLALLDEARQSVDSEGRPAVAVPVGAMIEVPAAALMIDHLAHRVDFFSVGTNDLIQYTLATDRTDAATARLVEPVPPAVLRLLRHVARRVRASGRPIAVCGELAADPRLLPLLVGVGFRTFSMTPAALPAARRALRALDTLAARQLAARALECATAAEVDELLRRWRPSVLASGDSIADATHSGGALGTSPPQRGR